MERTDGRSDWVIGAPGACVPAQSGELECAVAIPTRDEASLIARCLKALADQQDAPAFAVVLFLNNCQDDTAREVAAIAPSLPCALRVYEGELPPELADAAWARRLALNAAAALVRPEGVVLSTDADSFANPDWIRANLDCIERGADIVCGFVAPDFSDAPSLDFETLQHGAREYEYSQLASELLCLIDPDPADPWPRHQMETGANLAIRASVLRELGGVPHVCPGEDQALARLAERAGYAIRHDFKPQVTTSSRVQGRAAGGWSADLKARADHRRDLCHEKIEPALRVIRRARLRAGLRRCFGTPRFDAHATRLVTDKEMLECIRVAKSFTAAWALLSAASAMLAPRPLHRSALESNATLLRRSVEAMRAQAEHGPRSAPQMAGALQ